MKSLNGFDGSVGSSQGCMLEREIQLIGDSSSSMSSSKSLSSSKVRVLDKVTYVVEDEDSIKAKVVAVRER